MFWKASPACLALLLASPLHPQEVMRSPAFGHVTLQGSPASNCRIVCIGTAWHDADPSLDVIKATTDQRGVFMVQLIVDREYSCWAYTETAKGELAISQPRRLIRGQHVDISLGPPLPRQRLNFAPDSLPGEGMRWEVASDLPQRWWQPVKENSVLPPIPEPRLLRAVDAQGHVHWLGPQQQRQAVPQQGERISLHVVDPKGRPRRDAKVEIQLHQAQERRQRSYLGEWRDWHELGSTDANGDITLTLPSPSSLQEPERDSMGRLQSEFYLRVGHKHWGWQHVGVTGQPHRLVSIGATRLPEPKGNHEAWTIPLTHRARLTVTPAQECALFVLTGQLRLLDHPATALECRTNAEGIAYVPMQFHNAVHSVARCQRPGEPPSWTQVLWGKQGFTAALDFRPFELEIRHADRSPAQAVMAWLVPKVIFPFGTESPWAHMIPLELDAAARGQVAVGPGEWLVLACEDDQIGWHTIGKDDGAGKLTIDLQAMLGSRLRVLDSEGDPMPDHPVRWTSTHEKIPHSTDFSGPLTSVPVYVFDAYQGHTDQRGEVFIPLVFRGRERIVKLQGASPEILLEPGATFDVVLDHR